MLAMREDVANCISETRRGDYHYVVFDVVGKHRTYHNFRQLWLVLGVKLMDINSNLFSRLLVLGVCVVCVCVF